MNIIIMMMMIIIIIIIVMININTHLEHFLAGPLEHALVARHPHAVHHLPRQPKRHEFRNGQRKALLEDHPEVDVTHVGRMVIHQNVVCVAIAYAEDIPDHARRSNRPGVLQASRAPLHRIGEAFQEEVAERWLEVSYHFLEILYL